MVCSHCEEVKKKGYYHGRPPSTATEPPKRIDPAEAVWRAQLEGAPCPCGYMVGTTPRHKTNTCRKKFLGNYFLRQYMRGWYSRSREYRNMLLRSNFRHISHIWGGVHVGANTRRACIRTRANTGRYSWGIIYALVSCQGVTPWRIRRPKRGTS